MLYQSNSAHVETCNAARKEAGTEKAQFLNFMHSGRVSHPSTLMINHFFNNISSFQVLVSATLETKRGKTCHANICAGLLISTSSLPF
jgi:hypothetical protein